MKKLLLANLFVALSIAISAQTWNYMNVDSVRVRPANPSATDSVFMHVYWNSPWGCSLNGAPTVMNAGMNHAATFCYTVGMITVVTSGHDSVFLFQGPAGVHVVSWQIIQNGSPNSQCDWVRDANQMTINILPTGIDSRETAQQFSFVNNEFVMNESGTLSVFSVNGQLLFSSRVNAGQRIPFSAQSAQLYSAVFSDEEGNTSTLKFLGQ